MNYENYLQGLVMGANKMLDDLNDWQKDKEFDNDDIFFLAQTSYFIGYCLALEGLLGKDNQVKE